MLVTFFLQKLTILMTFYNFYNSNRYFFCLLYTRFVKYYAYTKSKTLSLFENFFFQGIISHRFRSLSTQQIMEKIKASVQYQISADMFRRLITRQKFINIKV